MVVKHVHNFINKHTALGIFILIVVCFFAGYFVGTHSKYNNYGMMRVSQFKSVRNY